MNVLKASIRCFFLLVLSLSIFFVGTSLAAQDGLKCDIFLQGSIDENSVSQLITNNSESTVEGEQKEFPPYSVLCLDSPGGDYSQALKLMDVIEKSIGIVTYIPNGAECSSACALVFLSGNTWIGNGATKQHNARIIHAGGRLGFHAPFTNFEPSRSFSGSDGNEIFLLAIKAMSQANSLRLSKRSSGEKVFNEFLFSGFISTPSESLFKIRTVGDAALGEIDIRGLPWTTKFGKNDMYRVCDIAIAKHVIGVIPTLLDGVENSSSILSLVVAERERFGAENKTYNQNYQEAVEGVTSDYSGNRRAAWLLQGYPSSSHHNNGLVCLVEIESPKRNYFATWSSGQKNFLEIDTFRYTIFDVSRDEDFASVSSLDEFFADNEGWITSFGSLPNWSALAPDYQIFSE